MPVFMPGPGDRPAEAQLPVNPFTALQFHFGMLLGVDDLETLEAYPRGKVRLHNAWLHREGIVWGLGVQLRSNGELQVNPGLAIDGAGRELHLDTPVCVSLGAWYQAHQGDPGFEVTSTEIGVTFGAHVVIRFRACLARPVPAISEPCEGAANDIAYSRAQETVELFLRPNAAAPRTAPYHRLRLLFGLDPPRRGSDGTIEPADQAVLDRRDAIRGKAAEEQPSLLLEAFREYAALDGIDLGPATTPDGASTLFPALDTAELVLADVSGIHLTKKGDGWELGLPLPTLAPRVRSSHVATSTIQELLCGLAGSAWAPDAGGPRVEPASVKLTGKTLTFTTTHAVAAKSVTQDALHVSTFVEATGWKALTIGPPVVDTATRTITVELDEEPPVGARVRLVVRGTGPMPVLGEGPGHVPLAGGVGGPPGTAFQGNDFTFMWTRS